MSRPERLGEKAVASADSKPYGEDDSFVPWYRGCFDSDIHERNVREDMELRRAWGENNLGVIIDKALMVLKPSEVVEQLIRDRLYPEDIGVLLATHGVDAFYIQQEGGDFIRVVDGHMKDNKGSLFPVYKEVHW